MIDDDNTAQDECIGKFYHLPEKWRVRERESEREGVRAGEGARETEPEGKRGRERERL